ncbi:MAG: DUF1501 domain-containing protein [Acidobacteriota bacterium]
MEQDQCSRRTMIRSLFCGSIVMPAVFTHLLTAEARGEENPLAPKAPHFPGKARRVIFLYMSGGVSHVDSFDPKPRLLEEFQKGNTRYLPALWEFKRRGKSGTEVSELFPQMGDCIDDICLIRSMRGDHNDHYQATMGIHTGSVTVKRPSIGSWLTYGLGTENQNLPAFVVLAPDLPYAGSQVWDSDFLPAVYQGTRVLSGKEPIPNINRRALSETIQKDELQLLERFNRRHLATRATDGVLAARLKSYETAFGMQRTMPEALDLSKETDATLKLYGLERGSAKGFAWQCLVARRLAERGVRFIELIDVGASNNWDAHADMKTHEPLARNVDRAIAGLLRDLKSRGMLEDTLVVWTSEFGRTPTAEGAKGRGHFNKAYSSWMAGGGVKGGMVYGKTDEFGANVVENEVHVHDFHATILHLLGFNHEKLTFRYAGRDFRLTDVHGRVVKELLA